MFESIGPAEILAVVATLVCVLVAFFVFQKKTGRNRTKLLLVGPSGAGKTLLFLQLTRGAFSDTQTSIDENADTLTREKGVGSSSLLFFSLRLCSRESREDDWRAYVPR
jgi:GTPase SAR1 family protein